MNPGDLDSGVWVVRDLGKASLFGPLRYFRSWASCRDCGWESAARWGDRALGLAVSHVCPD